MAFNRFSTDYPLVTILEQEADRLDQQANRFESSGYIGLRWETPTALRELAARKRDRATRLRNAAA